MNIAILGAGNMGGALAKGLLQSGLPPESLTLTCRNPEKHPELQTLGVRLLTDNALAVQAASVVIVAVKPWQVEEVLRPLAPVLRPETLVLSVAAGVSVAQLRALLPPEVQAVRAMPNTAVALNEGVIAIASDTASALERAQSLLAPLGLILPVEESKMDTLTALAGCGIAHALRFLRAAQCAGVQMGLTADQSAAVFAQVMAGAVALMRQPGATAESEIDRICTPGGLTVRGLNALEQAGFSAATIRGFLASLPEEKQ